jgi:hypothetical protein
MIHRDRIERSFDVEPSFVKYVTIKEVQVIARGGEV